MDSSQESTLRETARTLCFVFILCFGIHTGHNTAGSVRALVANQVTGFENSYFRTHQENGKSKDSQL